jgi:hypothetical protein
MVRAQSEAANTAALPTVLQRRRPLEHRPLCHRVDDRLHPLGVLRDGLGHPGGLQGQHADAVRAELGGQVDPGALARERAGDRAADGAAPAVDDRVLALEEHRRPPAVGLPGGRRAA